MNHNTEMAEEEAMLPERAVTDDLELLLAALPLHIRRPLEEQTDRDNLLEIVMDLGRKPEARYVNHEVYLSDRELTIEDLEQVTARIGNFGNDNRAGIERTLHRISCIRNRAGNIVGLTIRIGRAVFGTIKIIQDLVESGQSILIVGKPGVGKTTLLRETARVEADDLRKRVVIVDTSNEIAGDGDIPHPAIGRARRMQVARPDLQHNVMIEAVENHMPEVIVIDEIGTELEAQAARTIAERGVQLIGTAHGVSLENLMLNPTLSDLIGGIQSVTLGDEEARRRGTQKSVLERKAPPTFDVMVEIRDRDRVAVHLNVADTVDAILRGLTFPTQIRFRNEQGEIEFYEEEAEYEAGPIQGANNTPMDFNFPTPPGAFGGGSPFGGPFSGGGNSGGGYGNSGGSFGGRRSGGGGGGSTGGYGGGGRRPNRGGGNNPLAGPTNFATSGGGASGTYNNSDLALLTLPAPNGNGNAPRKAAPKAQTSAAKPIRIYPHGINRNRLEEAIKEMGLPASIVREIGDADMVMTLKNYYRQKPLSLRSAESQGVPIHIVKSNTVVQMKSHLSDIFGLQRDEPEVAEDYDKMPMDSDPVKNAIVQTEDAITSVLQKGSPVELPPQNSFIRRLQHQMAERYNLVSQSRGREPYRRVKIFPQA